MRACASPHSAAGHVVTYVPPCAGSCFSEERSPDSRRASGSSGRKLDALRSAQWHRPPYSGRAVRGRVIVRECILGAQPDGIPRTGFSRGGFTFLQKFRSRITSLLAKIPVPAPGFYAGPPPVTDICLKVRGRSSRASDQQVKRAEGVLRAANRTAFCSSAAASAKIALFAKYGRPARWASPKSGRDSSACP